MNKRQTTYFNLIIVRSIRSYYSYRNAFPGAENKGASEINNILLFLK